MGFVLTLQVAICFISINASKLAEYLGSHAVPFLCDKFTDINLAEPSLDLIKEGPSAGACQALALCLLLGCSLLDGRVGLTGYVDLRGRIMMVSSVREKLQHAKDNGLGRVIVPSKNLDTLKIEEWSDGEKEYALDAVRGATSFINVMTHTLQGEAEPLSPRVWYGTSQ